MFPIDCVALFRKVLFAHEVDADHQNQKKYTEAEQLYERSLVIVERSLGSIISRWRGDSATWRTFIVRWAETRRRSSNFGLAAERIRV